MIDKDNNKEGPPIRHLTLTAILTLSSALLAADFSAVSSAVALAKADPPSPVSPGFRGDGNAWYPAATRI
jgi:hypothetical protein